MTSSTLEFENKNITECKSQGYTRSAEHHNEEDVKDKRKDEHKLETRDLWRVVPAWIEMWNERPKTKVGVRISQWRGGGGSSVRGKTVFAGQIQTDTDGPTTLQAARGRAGILRCWMLNVGRRGELDKNNRSSSRAGAWSSKESMSQGGR
ncbi:hypothetical protein B0H13DRAFT_1895795 [Mycena leptocephala]|nr:hypothetical protein B0H13DRAFT_1895795 [Mycena leptocephala]